MTPKQPQTASFTRVVLVLAATVVALIGMRLAAPVLNPILFAPTLALIRGPVYAGLLRRGLPILLVLPIMLVGLGALSLAQLVFLNCRSPDSRPISRSRRDSGMTSSPSCRPSSTDLV